MACISFLTSLTSNSALASSSHEVSESLPAQLYAATGGQLPVVPRVGLVLRKCDCSFKSGSKQRDSAFAHDHGSP
eukprot:m.467710 g.467710  ORF g.467710 m.467710 type:complete len:75 (+) comp20366_c2_seq2:535-759(+)